MINIVETTIQAICILILFFISSGFIYYKSGKADTWESGIKKVFIAIYDFFYEGATGKSPSKPDKEIDVRLYLSSEEMIGLTRALEQVYEHLHLANGIIYTEDIAWFDYSAFGITAKYKDVSLDVRKRLLISIINKYYQEIHGTLCIPIYVKISSEFRLYFAIALNQAGQNYLDAQEQFNTCTEDEFRSEYSTKIIEESISKDKENDFRL